MEKCGYFVTLRKRNVKTASPYSSFGAAFAALVAGRTDEANAARARLTAQQDADLFLLAARYLAELPRGEGAECEYHFALLPNGERCEWEDPRRVTRGKIDAWWKYRDGGVWMVLRDDKTGVSHVPHPADNLQFGVYAKALEAEAFGARIIGEIAKPAEDNPKKRLIRYEYQPGEVEGLWERFLRAAAKVDIAEPPAEPGGHCSDCWERQRCDARLLPAMSPTAPELAPFMAGGPPLTQENARAAIRVVQAMGDVYETAIEQLRAYALENGPIIDGEKKWGPIDVAGKKSADLAAIEAAGASQFIKRGKPSLQFRWTNAGR